MIDERLKLELIKKYPYEKVYVIPFEQTKSIKDRFNPFTAKYTYNNFNRMFSNGLFVPRYDAEYNDTMSQLIPYVVVFNKNKNKIYISYRIAGDSRLRFSYSLGYGGHINPIDIKTGLSLCESSANRELNEELILKNSFQKYPIGTVRDLSSDTREHVGIVYCIIVEDIQVREKDTLEGQWFSLNQLVEHYYDFESWGRYIIDYLFVTYKKYSSLNTLFNGKGCK